MNAQQILDTLKTGVYYVTFAKDNGETRMVKGSAPADAFIRTDGIVPIVEDGTGAWKSFRASAMLTIVSENLVA
jgi:hypothetical protein